MAAVDSLLEEVGGLDKLVNKLESSGLGSKATSWIGTGPNESLDVGDVKNALGRELDDVAQKLGIGRDEAAEEVAQTLPDAVDKATPDGTLPSGSDGQQVPGQENGRG